MHKKSYKIIYTLNAINMSVAGRICVRPLADLLCQKQSNKSEESELGNLQQKKKRKSLPDGANEEESPVKARIVKKKAPKTAATTSKKPKEEQNTAFSTAKKSRSNKKLLKTDDRQKTIDCFYKSASKTFSIPPRTSKEISSDKKRKPTIKRSRRRIVYNDKDECDTSASKESKFQVASMRKTNKKPVDVIDLCLLDSEDEQTEKAIIKDGEDVQTVETNVKNAKKTNRRILQSSSSEKSETFVNKLKVNCTFSGNCENIEAGKNDEVAPDSQGTDITSSCKRRNNISLKLRSTKKTSHKKLESLLQQSVTESNQETYSQQTITEEATLEEQVITCEEAITSVLENSPPTTSSHRKASCSILITKSDKENCEPETRSHSSTSPFKRKSELNSSTTNEATSFISKKVEVDLIVDISDDDFEYVQARTKSAEIKTKNYCKTRSKPKNNEPEAKKSKRTPPALPAYKIIEGTNGTMAVDAFRFGDIEGVSHYFLTHFHADHYIGLTRKFSHTIYMSSITARLLRAFIPIEEQYIKELELNKMIKIDGIEVTAIDANHCPGAIMLIFKLPDGRCMLHTGDFRASADMESEPIFWNNDMHTIYLDTTYISQKYAFCHQSESIERAKQQMQEFIEKNVGTRVLFVCGAYLIGKEKFWSTLAEHFNFKVYTEGNRKKALVALQDKTLNALLTENPYNAQMHVIPLQKLSYAHLLEYLGQYDEYYDLVLALRPSGWEKNSRPQFRGKVNIIGIEYSEHSSHDEMRRFVQYLKPQNVISTVPVTSNAMITAKVPKSWYKYTVLQRQYQPSITSFFKIKPDKYYRQLTKKYATIPADNATLKKSPGEQTMPNEPSMFVSLDSADHTIDHNLPVKQEIIAKHPNVTEPIVIDCDTDDDWLT